MPGEAEKLRIADEGAAFQAHPYRVPGVGWMSDLERVTRPRAEEFRRAHYVPANAVATLVGDIDPAAVEALARRYFGALPGGAAAPPPATIEPEQRGERRVTVEFDVGDDQQAAALWAGVGERQFPG